MKPIFKYSFYVIQGLSGFVVYRSCLSQCSFNYQTEVSKLWLSIIMSCDSHEDLAAVLMCSIHSVKCRIEALVHIFIHSCHAASSFTFYLQQRWYYLLSGGNSELEQLRCHNLLGAPNSAKLGIPPWPCPTRFGALLSMSSCVNNMATLLHEFCGPHDDPCNNLILPTYRPLFRCCVNLIL